MFAKDVLRAVVGILSLFSIGVSSNVAKLRLDNDPQQITQEKELNGRRQWQWPSYKRFEIRKRTEDEAPAPAMRSVDEVIVSVDTGARDGASPGQSSAEDSNLPNPLATIQKAIMDISRKPNNPIYRAQEHYNIKPKFIQFRAQENPSLKLEINSESIVRALSDLLSSQTVRRYADVVGKKAADVYSALTDDIEKYLPNEARPVYK